MTRKLHIGPMLRSVLAVGALLGPLARPHLKRRLAKGKEDPERWQEKLGVASHPRPDGPLVWLHGVGLGEVMALRGLIEQLSNARPDLNFLVTSSARSSGDVFAKNLPARTIHQYLPLDMPAPVSAFLDHWKPDLAVWSDQEVWPRMAVTVARRSTAQALVAARITKDSAKAKARFGAAYGDLYRLLDLRHAQDARTADALRSLMDDDSEVKVTGSIKPAAAPLADDPALRAKLPQDRPIWVAASAHAHDVEAALQAQKIAKAKQGKDWLLIIAPRLMADAGFIEETCIKNNISYCKRSESEWPNADTQVFIADSFGELGIWYRAAQAALIGGTFNDTEGHNPWEAVASDCAVLHGPCVQNFASDYALLDQANAAREIAVSRATGLADVDDLVAALCDAGLPQMAHRATQIRTEAAVRTREIADDLLGLLDV